MPNTESHDPFGRFLQEATNEQSQQEDAERGYTEAAKNLWTEVTSMEVPHVFDADPEEQDRRTHEAIQQAIERLRTESSDEDEDSLRIRAAEEVSRRVAAEIFAFQYILMVREAADHEADQSVIEQDKKRLLATLMVDKSFAITDPWVVLANKVVPGEEFDAEDLGDMMYLFEAQLRHSSLTEQGQQNATILGQALEIAGVDDVTNERSIGTTQLVCELAQIAAQPRLGNRAATERRAQLDEAIRNSQYKIEDSAAVIGFLEEAYPL